MISRISIVIPTYNRYGVLFNTLSCLLEQRDYIEEILIIDQTLKYDSTASEAIGKLQKEGLVRWLRLTKPSIPKAMNLALDEAKSEILLFLDDDIVPDKELVVSHINVYKELGQEAWAVAGKVVQQEFKVCNNGFCFDSDKRGYIDNIMAGNFSIKKDKAIKIGGFDENFLAAAYRFETEFADRIIQSGGKIFFEPKASIEHLKVKEGGIRSRGDFLVSFLPDHTIGAYYYIFRSKRFRPAYYHCLLRFIKSIAARYYLKKPWFIPVRLFSEAAGFFIALALFVKGPKLNFPKII